MTSIIQYGISFTAKDGSEAKITGDENAIIAIERALHRAGIRFNNKIETWDEGYYVDEPEDDYAERAEWKTRR